MSPEPLPDGVLVVDKPAGPTSHDVVASVRRATGWQKVGHTGTLDPLATGVLPLVVGRATRLARFLTTGDKVYDAEVRLGWATDTYDAEGTPVEIAKFERPKIQRSDGPTVESSDFRTLGPSDLDRILDRFRGSYLQAAPPFSAKKIDGVRAYEMARNGNAAVTRECAVTVHEIACLERTEERLCLRLSCTAGFYVRTFAHELGLTLGCGAHLSALRRTRSGDFYVRDAVPLEAVLREGPAAAARLVPLERLLCWMPAVIVNAQGAARTAHGNDMRAEDIASGGELTTTGWVRLLDEDGALLAVAESREMPGVLHPRVVVR